MKLLFIGLAPGLTLPTAMASHLFPTICPFSSEVNFTLSATLPENYTVLELKKIKSC
jgi:hypothetical protein